jgi:ABC-type transport system involved in cytochrome bd biosynthesis fused ATPase/permease subunit
MRALLLVLFIVPVLSFADQKQENLNEAKAKVTSNIDKRIANLNTFKSCVQSASTHDQMKACREKHRSSSKALKSQMKSEWKARKNQRKAEKKK